MTRAQGVSPQYLRDYCLKGIGPQQGTMLIEPTLRKRVQFMHLNLLDAPPPLGTFDVIFVRNVMIYFDKALQNHVHELFHRSLVNFGILTLGRKESIRFTSHESHYEPVDLEERIYKKVR